MAVTLRDRRGAEGFSAQTWGKPLLAPQQGPVRLRERERPRTYEGPRRGGWRGPSGSPALGGIEADPRGARYKG
jgi:hypothetical protein